MDGSWNFDCNGISEDVKITALGGVTLMELNGQLRPSIQKKPYQEPRFCIYGDIRTITQANVVPGGTFDGNNKGSVHKTV